MLLCAWNSGAYRLIIAWTEVKNIGRSKLITDWQTRPKPTTMIQQSINARTFCKTAACVLMIISPILLSQVAAAQTCSELPPVCETSQWNWSKFFIDEEMFYWMSVCKIAVAQSFEIHKEKKMPEWPIFKKMYKEKILDFGSALWSHQSYAFQREPHDIYLWTIIDSLCSVTRITTLMLLFFHLKWYILVNEVRNWRNSQRESNNLWQTFITNTNCNSNSQMTPKPSSPWQSSSKANMQIQQNLQFLQ